MPIKSDDFTDARIAQIAKELQLLKTNRQIEVLNSRENEDRFLAGVQPLRAEEARLRNLNIDMTRLKLVTIDQQALEPLSPIKPRRILIVAFGLIFGVVLGLALALARHFVKTSIASSRQKYVAVEASSITDPRAVERV